MLKVAKIFLTMEYCSVVKKKRIFLNERKAVYRMILTIQYSGKGKSKRSVVARGPSTGDSDQ